MYGFNGNLTRFSPPASEDIQVVFTWPFSSLWLFWALPPSWDCTSWFSSLSGLSFWVCFLNPPFLWWPLKHWCFPGLGSWLPTPPSCHMLTSNLNHLHGLAWGSTCSSSAAHWLRGTWWKHSRVRRGSWWIVEKAWCTETPEPQEENNRSLWGCACSHCPSGSRGIAEHWADSSFATA